jgi:hypothetical protein
MEAEALYAEEMHAENMHARTMHATQVASLAAANPPPLLAPAAPGGNLLPPMQQDIRLQLEPVRQATHEAEMLQANDSRDSTDNGLHPAST